MGLLAALSAIEAVTVVVSILKCHSIDVCSQVSLDVVKNIEPYAALSREINICMLTGKH